MWWEEKFPVIGDIVKVEFTSGEILIGVVMFFSIQGFVVADFGRTRKYLDRLTTFFVLVK